MSDEVIEALKRAAAQDAPPADLGPRVLEHVAYRARLEAPLWAERRARAARRFAAAGALVALAAGLWVWRRPPGASPRIAAEQPSRAGAAVAPSAVAAVPSALAARSAPPVDPCRVHVAAAGRAPLIDDFEDGDDALAPLEQRAGFWRWAREDDAPGTAPALLPVPRFEASSRDKLALHVKGGRLFDWGATVEVNFRPPCYDASSYAGIALQARGPGRIYVSLREVGVIPVFEGGSCVSDCYNSHVSKLELGRDWRSYRVTWAELHQRGIGMPPLDPSRLHSIAIMIRAEDTPYDVWLDDFRFLPREASR